MREVLQGGKGDDDELIGALVLERLQIGVELRAVGRLRRLASSTTRPVSAGKVGSAASAGPMQNSKRDPEKDAAQAPRRGAHRHPRSRRPSLELDLRHLGDLLGDGEILHRLRVGIEQSAPPAAGDGPDLGVVVLNRGDVVAPGDGDAVLGALELRLQREKIRVRLQVGIGLADREQPPQRAGELALRLLEFLERLGVGEDVGRNLHLRRLGARLDDLGQHLAFLSGIALHRLDQIGDEVGAALILVQDLAPRGLGLFLEWAASKIQDNCQLQKEPSQSIQGGIPQIRMVAKGVEIN